jgi:AraC-like DNA-binding protein
MLLEEKPKQKDQVSSGITQLAHVTQTCTRPRKIAIDDDKDFLALVLNLENDIDFSWIRGEVTGTVKKDRINLVYIPCNSFVMYNLKPGTYSLFTIEFKVSFFNQWTNQFVILDQFMENIHRKIPCMVSSVPIKRSSKPMEIVHELLSAPDGSLSTETMNRKANEIIAIYLQEINNESTQLNLLNGPSRVWKACDLMLKNLRLQWTMDLLAMELGVEKKRLSSEFKKLYRKTVFEFLFEQRMKKAADLIKYSNLSLKQIAAAVGYQSYSQFTKAYHRTFGHLPSTLKRDGTSDEETP